MFRHAFGTHLVEDGYDIVRVQGMMGHSSLETTKLYVTLSKEQFKGIINPLDKLYEEKNGWDRNNRKSERYIFTRW